VEIRLIDASTGKPAETFIGRKPYLRHQRDGRIQPWERLCSRAIDLSLEDNPWKASFDKLDLLDWATTIAGVEGENIYLNAGKLSGIRNWGHVRGLLNPGKEIFHPTTNLSLGWDRRGRPKEL